MGIHVRIRKAKRRGDNTDMIVILTVKLVAFDWLWIVDSGDLSSMLVMNGDNCNDIDGNDGVNGRDKVCEDSSE